MTTKTETTKQSKYQFLGYTPIPGFVFGGCVFQSPRNTNMFELNLGFVRLLWGENA